MADRLRPCGQCGTRLAPDATRCPSCGGLTSRARTVRLIVGLLVIVALVGGGGLYLNHRQQAKAADYAKCIAAGGTDATC